MRPLSITLPIVPLITAAFLLFIASACASDDEPPENGAPVPCSAPTDCGANEVCDFPDDLCGSGKPGVCMPRPDVCTDGLPACGCDGQVYMSSGCAPLEGVDVAVKGGCTPPSGTFACGSTFCFAPGSYCEETTLMGEGCEGTKVYECAFFDTNCAPQDCTCLAGLECSSDPEGNETAKKTSPTCSF
jgi:hypothetical protein